MSTELSGSHSSGQINEQIDAGAVNDILMAGDKSKGGRPYFFDDPAVKRVLNISMAVATEVVKMKTFFIVIFILLNGVAYSQQELTGKEILHKATTASGGNTWQQPTTLQLNGNARWTPYGKTDPSESIYFDTYKMYRVFPVENNAAHSANGKIRFDAKYGDSLYLQLIYDGKNTLSYLSDKAKPYQKYFSWSNNFGFGIIRFAERDSFKVERLTDDQVDGHPVFIVQITDPKKMVTTFSIDQKTFLIRGVAFNTDIGYHHRIYSDFEKLNPLAGKGFFMQPKRLRIYFDGIKWMDIRWEKNVVNGKIEDQIFVK